MRSLAPKITIECERVLPFATVQLMRLQLDEPIEFDDYRLDSLHLDCSLTPRPPNAALCFDRPWGRDRYHQPGRAFLVPPDQRIRARTDAGQQLSVTCDLDTGELARLGGVELEWTDRRLEAGLDIDSPMIVGLLERLATEIRDPGLASEPLCEAMVIQLAIEVQRHFTGVSEEPISGGLSPWRLRMIEERLGDDRSPPSLADLAELCGISVRQLTRGYRASCGRSIGEHIASTRMLSAKARLVAGESVKSTAYAMGFGSPSSFCCAFRRAVGLTPQQFRTLNRSAERVH